MPVDYKGQFDVTAHVNAHHITGRDGHDDPAGATYIVDFQDVGGNTFYMLSIAYLRIEKEDAYARLQDIIGLAEPLLGPDGRFQRMNTTGICKLCDSRKFVAHRGTQWSVVHCKECDSMISKVPAPEHCEPLGLGAIGAMLF
jgi:hypothetical protein